MSVISVRSIVVTSPLHSLTQAEGVLSVIVLTTVMDLKLLQLAGFGRPQRLAESLLTPFPALILPAEKAAGVRTIAVSASGESCSPAEHWQGRGCLGVFSFRRN